MGQSSSGFLLAVSVNALPRILGNALSVERRQDPGGQLGPTASIDETEQLVQVIPAVPGKLLREVSAEAALAQAHGPPGHGVLVNRPRTYVSSDPWHVRFASARGGFLRGHRDGTGAPAEDLSLSCIPAVEKCARVSQCPFDQLVRMGEIDRED
jgi:hypothetical protein